MVMNRDDLTTGASMDFTPPVSAFTEQFSNMSVNDKQWPDLGRDGDSGSACGGHGRRRRLDDRERRTRDSPRELTWEERIRKGAVQKERVEQRGFDRTERNDRDNRESNSLNGRYKGQRNGRSIGTGKTENNVKNPPLPPVQERCPTANRSSRDHPSRSFASRGNRVADKLCNFDMGPRLTDAQTPLSYRQGIPLLVSRNAYYPARPPPFVCIPQQDQRFRNTWLDASLAINYPSIPLMDCAYAPCYRSRPPASGRSGYRYQCSRSNPAREIAKLRVQLSSSMKLGNYEPNVVKSEHANDSEEVWESETEEEKQKRWDSGVYWPFEKANLEKKRLEEEEKKRLEEEKMKRLEEEEKKKPEEEEEKRLEEEENGKLGEEEKTKLVEEEKRELEESQPAKETLEDAEDKTAGEDCAPKAEKSAETETVLLKEVAS
ncbi:hypothetical protein Y032_0072g649 [Ancylostoma ceylanicum]|uniref:Uncharacterized protein n=2 Tax=Ancylostoma ceylanicum TaxID=53326 RepID=A0A016TVF8_9BILA|nr:hypothetical protein Y032_0072g649 [Ancylostoma ceylanicum]